MSSDVSSAESASPPLTHPKRARTRSEKRRMLNRERKKLHLPPVCVEPSKARSVDSDPSASSHSDESESSALSGYSFDFSGDVVGKPAPGSTAQPSTPRPSEDESAADQTNSEAATFLDRFPRAFESWTEFDAAFASFCKNSYQIFSKRTSKSVKSRNQQAEKRWGNAKTHRRGSAKLIPDDWGVYSKTFQCTHGIARASQSSGRRGLQFVRYTQCSAKVNATVTAAVTGKYQVVISASGSHNHVLDAEVHASYAESRTIRDPELIRRVSEMQESGSHARGILAFLRAETGMYTTDPFCNKLSPTKPTAPTIHRT